MGEIEHITGLSMNGWTGVLTMSVLLGFMFSLGVWGSQYVRIVSQVGRRGRKMVNYTDEVRELRTDVMLGASVVLSVALAVFGVAVRWGWIDFGFGTFAAVVAATALVFVLKTALGSFVAYVFSLEVVGAKVWMMARDVAFGVLCLPVSWLAATVTNVNVALVTFVILLLAGLIAEFVILVENFFTKTDTLFYIFLYLCAAEILPLTVGLRYVSQVFN